MTKNWNFDGDPKAGEFWTCVARSPSGEYGVSLGIGAIQVTFLPEADVARLLAGALKDDPDEHTAMLRAAYEQLPAFKHSIETQTRNAPLN